MHKFTLVTVLLTLTIIAITIDVVVNGYSVPKDYIPEEQAPVTVQDTRVKVNEKSLGETGAEVESNVSSDMAPVVGADDEGGVVNTPITDTQADVDYEFTLTEDSFAEEIYIEAGAEKPILKFVSGSQYLLQVIPIDESIQKNLRTANVFDFEQYLGTIYALQTTREENAKKLYSDLKAQSLALEGVVVKELNAFGDQSFYVNQSGKTKTAFAITRIGAHIYGFEYPHGSHQFFKQLASTLQNRYAPAQLIQ